MEWATILNGSGMWHCLCPCGDMTLTFHRKRWLVAAFIGIFATLAGEAQDGYNGVPLPNISRVCLWNADRVTWKALGLKKPQIERLGQLRLLYPAVVDGQWVVGDVGSPVPEKRYWVSGDPNFRRSISSRGAATSEKENGPRLGTTHLPHEGLQNDVREVLTPEQLRHWARLCEQR